jgi:hypothetical protein
MKGIEARRKGIKIINKLLPVEFLRSFPLASLYITEVNGLVMYVFF